MSGLWHMVFSSVFLSFICNTYAQNNPEKNVLSYSSLEYVKTVEEISQSNKHPDEKVFRILEIWDFRPSQWILEELLKKAEEENSPLKIVTAQEIQEGLTSDGYKIGDNTRYFLDDAEKIDFDEVKSYKEIRVSIAALVQIAFKDPETGEARFLILKNRGAFARGEHKATPIGGAYEANKPVREIFSLAQAKIKINDESKELRFKVDSRNVSDVSSWFASGLERELHPIREIVEELVDENHILKREMLGPEFIAIRSWKGWGARHSDHLSITRTCRNWLKELAKGSSGVF